MKAAICSTPQPLYVRHTALFTHWKGAMTYRASLEAGCGQEAAPPPVIKHPISIVNKTVISAELLVTLTTIFRDFPQPVRANILREGVPLNRLLSKTQTIRRPGRSPVITIFLFNSTLRTMNDVWKWKVIAKQATAVFINHWWNRVVVRAWLLVQKCINFHKTIIQGKKYTSWGKVLLLSIFRRLSKSAKTDGQRDTDMSVCLSLRPSIRQSAVGSHWTDFHQI